MIAKSFAVQEQAPLATTRALLRDIWRAAALDGIYIAARVSDQPIPESALIESAPQLKCADPFAPAMTINRAPHALQALQDHPHQRLGVFLRPCEWRTYQALLDVSEAPINNAVTICADCTGAMSEKDFVELCDGDCQALTHQVLQFATQGGILPSRNQSSCQLCKDPFPSKVDVHFELFGIPTTEFLILNFQDPDLALTVSDLAAGADVPAGMEERRKSVLADLARWRAKSFAKRSEQLGSVTLSFDGLTEHLLSCETCRVALREHCPLIDLEMLTAPGNDLIASVQNWVYSCSGCGVCESDCPDDYPLFSVIFALRDMH